MESTCLTQSYQPETAAMALFGTTSVATLQPVNGASPMRRCSLAHSALSKLPVLPRSTKSTPRFDPQLLLALYRSATLVVPKKVRIYNPTSNEPSLPLMTNP